MTYLFPDKNPASKEKYRPDFGEPLKTLLSGIVNSQKPYVNFETFSLKLGKLFLLGFIKITEKATFVSSPVLRGYYEEEMRRERQLYRPFWISIWKQPLRQSSHEKIFQFEFTCRRDVVYYLLSRDKSLVGNGGNGL